MEFKNVYNSIIDEIVKKSMEKYNFVNYIDIENIFRNIAKNTIEEIKYEPNKNLNDNVFIKRSIIDNIDRFMVSLSLNDKNIYETLELNLMKVLNTATKINKDRFKNISEEDKEYYKEYAILKALETYNENVKESLNIYVVDWFMAFINKEVNEESEKLLIKSI